MRPLGLGLGLALREEKMDDSQFVGTFPWSDTFLTKRVWERDKKT